jgi:hypothetical protein
MVLLWRRRGAVYYHDHEQAANMVLWGESFHRLTVVGDSHKGPLNNQGKPT